MANPAKKKKGEQPKTSPKHNAAELRKKLFTDLEPIEREAREVLNVINKLRHGVLDYIAKLEATANAAEEIASALDKLQSELTKEGGA